MTGAIIPRLVRLLCDPSRQEELAGDLEELYARRVRQVGTKHARARQWLDLVSVSVRQSRARSWTARQWATGGLLLATLAASGASAHDLFPSGPYSISARDAAGSFTLKLRNGKVLEATVNELPFPLERIVQSASAFVLKGVGAPVGGAPGDLIIRVTPNGGISWKGRPAPPMQPGPIDLSLAQEYLAELATASAKDAGKLWGRPLFGPILFADRATRLVAATQGDSGGRLTRDNGLFTGTLTPEVPIANTATRWSGVRWTMIIWPLPGDYYARQRLGFHELFHRLQPELRLVPTDLPNDHLDTRDGRVWTRLEWRALAEALVREGSARKAAVEDALTFRARRWALFPKAAAAERALELNEGLAEYTGLKLSGLPERLLADRAAVELARREQSESLVRSFAYASGPAYGILLDESRVGASWRRGLSLESDLSGLLRAAYGLNISADSASADRRAHKYGGRRVLSEETALAEQIAKNAARLRARLVDGPTVSFPVASRFSYSFDPNSVTTLQGLGSVHESARVSDEWGILTVESGGVLLVRAEGGITRVVVGAPHAGDAAPTSGEGWRLELAPGWVLVRGSREGSWEARRAP